MPRSTRTSRSAPSALGANPPSPPAPTSPALQSAALDPYLSFQRTSDDSTVYLQAVRLVLGTPASSSDIAITNTDLDGTRHLRIDADTVEFGATSASDATPFTLTLPGKNVTIVARVVVGDGGTIDTSGTAARGFPPGQAPRPQVNAASGGPPGQSGANGADGTPGDPGPAGENAGNVTIVADVIVGALNVRAMGGDGGRGEDGGGAGNGADGVKGQDGLTYGNSVDSRPTRGGNGGTGGRGGMAGIPGVGGAAGQITVVCAGGTNGVAAVASHGKAGPAATPGVAGHKGQGAPGGDMYWVMTPGGSRTLIPNTNAGSGWDGDDGASGALDLNDLWQIATIIPEVRKQGPDVFAGNIHYATQPTVFWCQGALAAYLAVERVKPPAPSLTTAPDYTTLFNAARPPLTQLQLSSHQAKISYLDSDFADAGNLLAWISRATTLPTAPVTTPTAPPASELPQWKTLNGRAATLLAQLAHGADYFGNATNYVPLVAYSAYQADLGQIFALASTIQTDYETYTTAAKDQAAQYAAVDRSIKNVTAAVGKLSDQVTALATDQQQVDTMIETLNDDQQTKQRVMDAANQAFKDAVSKQSDDCSFSDVLTAVTTIVSIGEAAYGVFKDVKDVVDSIDGLSSISGVVSGVKTIVSTAKAVAGDAGDAESQFEAIQSGFQSIEGAVNQAPDTAKLIMNEQDFDTAMQPYLDLPEAQNYVQAVHDYVSVVQARNQKILESDSFATQIAQLNAAIDDQNAIAASVQSAWSAKSDPTLAPIRAFMSALYQDARSNLLTLMYQENQAQNYMLLTDSAFAATGDTIAELAATQTDMITKVIDAQNQVASMPGEFEGATITLTAADYPDEFTAFHKTGQLTFRVGTDFDPFSGYASTRLTGIDITMPGVTTTDPNHYVLAELDHSGSALFVTTDAKTIAFSHRPVALDYKFDYTTGARKSQPKLDPSLIGLSPITTWTLSVTVTRKGVTINPGLDLSAVTSVSVTFHGTTDYISGTSSKGGKGTKAPKATEAVLPRALSARGTTRGTR